MKRLIAAVLWTLAFWYLGALIAMLTSVSDYLGPVLGLLGGTFIVSDPRGWFRTRGAATRA